MKYRLKRLFRLFMLRTFGYDPYYVPKPIKPTGYHTKYGHWYNDINEWAINVLNK